MRRLRVYVAGPYSADNIMDVFKNIRRGIQWSVKLLTIGFAPFTPWTDFQISLGDELNQIKIEDYYQYSLEWLSVSDVVFVQGKWETSKGTIAEIAQAEKLEIPVYYEWDHDLGYDIEALLKYAKANDYYLSPKGKGWLELLTHCKTC
jgi:hypothetical protein